ncbi:uncharacterized protein LOC143296996 [Babylonia areolata]|uniref:uncharacterized protein LOC143296996 n=1 Tax=Babylonia areolata TaxID=304850 RepID=UPI003FD00822
MAEDRACWYFQCAILLLLLQRAFTIPPYELCSAANYDVRNLTSKMWRFPLDANSCLKPRTANATGNSCEVTMAFCRAVNMSASCTQAEVCETFGSVNDTFNLATFTPLRNPFNTEGVTSGSGFTTRYNNGETYTKADKTTCTLRTQMTFLCNRTATWDSSKAADVLTVPLPPKVQFLQPQGDRFCTYNVTFQFAGACPIVGPSEPATQLSAGSVLLLIFFVTMFLYFGLGCLINMLRGETGKNLLPHHQFWVTLPGYIKEGFLFTLTCGGSSPSQRTYESI